MAEIVNSYLNSQHWEILQRQKEIHQFDVFCIVILRMVTKLALEEIVNNNNALQKLLTELSGWIEPRINWISHRDKVMCFFLFRI